MSKEIRRARDAANSVWLKACRQSSNYFKDKHHLEISLGQWSNSVRQEFEDSWTALERNKDTSWDWAEIYRRYVQNRIKNKVAVLKYKETLSGLALFKVSKKRLLVNFLEGNPSTSCPLKGNRAIILLDLAVRYAQGLGCCEIHLQPVSSKLRDLYINDYGFKEAKDAEGRVILSLSLE